MKATLSKTIAAAIVLAAALSINVACSSDKSNTKTGSKPVAAAQQGNLPNYRYVDLDTILNNYNLAKDYNEEMLRMQNNLDQTARQKENAIQSAAAQLEQKYRNNTYLSQADQQAIQTEQQRIVNMRNQAQRELAGLQQNFQNAAAKAQQTVSDSIEAFIQDYNSTHNYDAIFIKGTAEIYINPALDITNEIIEGLNARYNKVKK